MRKVDLVREISDRTGLEKSAVLSCVENLMDVVKETMAKGENIYLRGFGTFLVKERKEKVARNISENTSIIVPAHKVASFKPSRDFKIL